MSHNPMSNWLLFISWVRPLFHTPSHRKSFAFLSRQVKDESGSCGKSMCFTRSVTWCSTCPSNWSWWCNRCFWCHWWQRFWAWQACCRWISLRCAWIQRNWFVDHSIWTPWLQRFQSCPLWGILLPQDIIARNSFQISFWLLKWTGHWGLICLKGPRHSLPCSWTN